MRCSRLLAALTAAMLLVVYSGCGDSEAKKDPAATGSGGTAQAKTDNPSAAAGKVAADKVVGDRVAAAREGAMDVSLVTPDDFAALVIHPRRIAQSPLVAEQLKDEMIAGAIKKFGIDPSEVEQIVVLVSMDAKGVRGPVPNFVMSTRFTHDVDAKEVLAKFQAAIHGPEPIKEVTVGGKTCLDLGAAPDAPRAYVPSKNTIVLTMKENMEKVVSVSEPKGPLWTRLKKVDADNDVMLLVEPQAIPNFDKMIDAATKGGSMDLEAAKNLQGGTATFNLAAPLMLRVVLDAKDAEAAGNVEEMLQQLVRMASGGLMMIKPTVPKEMKDTFGPLLKLAEEFVDGAKTAKSGSQATLDVKRPEILDTAGPSIVNAVRQSVLASRAAARQQQQMAKMKQICIAMLMYEQTHQTYPPAVIEKDGKPLLSWRVAILPYLGEDVLYKRFHLDEPWDSPRNLEAAKTMPWIFQSPDSPNAGKTRVMLFTGKGAAFDGGKKISNREIRDGTSNTLLCVEAGADKAVPWSKPEDLPFDPEKPLAALGNVSPQGFIAAFFDGSVRQLKIDNETLKALITPDGGEVINPAKLRGGR